MSVSSFFDRVVNTREIGEATLKKAETYIELKKSEQSQWLVKLVSIKPEVIYQNIKWLH